MFLLNGGAQARARFADAPKLDDKIGDLKTNLVGLPEFVDAAGIYALPLTIQGFPVYDNKKLYADAGLDPNAVPNTWDDLTKICAAIIAKGAVPCFALGNKKGFGMELWFSSIAASLWTADGGRSGRVCRGQAALLQPAGEGRAARLGRCQQGRLVPERRQFHCQVHGRIRRL